MHYYIWFPYGLQVEIIEQPARGLLFVVVIGIGLLLAAFIMIGRDK